MDNNLKNEIDSILEKVGAINDLNMKADILTYMQQQSGFMLWQIEEDLHVDQNMKNI